MRNFTLLVLAWLLLAGTVPTAQSSGGNIYVQEVAPSDPAGLALGYFWLKPSADALSVLKSLSPITWVPIGGGGGSSIPAGSILLVDSGTCPTGFAEVAALNGKTLVGTLAANLDVGTTGGSDTLTPAGSVTAPTLTMNSYTPQGSVSAPVFSGVQLATHLHAAGTIAVTAHTSVATKQGAAAGNVVTTATHTVSGSTAAITAGTPAGTNSAPVLTGTPATLTGSTSAPTFTGTPTDNRSAFVRILFCKKT